MNEANKNINSAGLNNPDQVATTSQEKSTATVAQPLTDIYESKEGATIYVDLPGVSKELVDIHVDQNVLAVKGTVKLDIPENLQPHYMDIRSGGFERFFTLGEELDSSNIQASFNQGQLKLFIPVAEQHKPHKIEVKTV
jgi:HSP20 family protein